MADIKVSPTMTSNTAPSPYVISASTFFAAGYEAWRAFDAAANSWDTSSGNHTGWIKLDFGSGNAWPVYKYTMQSLNAARSPKNWTLQGSNDDTNWDILDTQTGILFGASETKTFTCTNKKSYRYLKIDVTLLQNTSELVEILELQYYYDPSRQTNGSLSFQFI